MSGLLSVSCILPLPGKKDLLLEGSSMCYCSWRAKLHLELSWLLKERGWISYRLCRVGSWKRWAWGSRKPWAEFWQKYVEKVIFLIYYYEFYDSENYAEIEEPFQLYLLSLRSIIVVGTIKRLCVGYFWSWLSGTGHEGEHVNPKGLSENHEVFFKRFFFLLFLIYLLPKLVSSTTLLRRKMTSELILHDFYLI